MVGAWTQVEMEGEFAFARRLRQQKASPQKNFGGASLHPREFLSNFRKRLTSFSWLSFSLPFYSPPNFLNFPPALLAERVFNHHV
jgi:hypothetical protein